MKKKAKKRTKKTERSRSRKHRAVSAIACPRCGASKGLVCVTKWSTKTETHAARIKAYIKLPLVGSGEAAQQSVSPETPPTAESSDSEIGRGPGTEA